MVGEDAMISDMQEAAPIIVLLVEDVVALRMSTAHYLRKVGFTVIEAGNSADALGVVASGIRIDLVFTDVQMPGDLDGRGLAKQLAVDVPELPVIITSGESWGSVDAAGDAMRAFVRKPYELEDIERQIIEFVGAPPLP